MNIRTRILLSFSPLFAIPLVCCSGDKGVKESFVQNVIDGDTFTLKNKERIRLFGVDTLELNHDEKLQVNYYAFKALEFSRDRIEGQVIEYQNITKDVYDRIVAKVFINGNDLALDLLSNGLAKVRYIDLNKWSPFYTNDYSYYETLLLTQEEAFMNKIGIWS